MPQSDAQHLQCMEVWGGNRSADAGVVMAGLDAWVYSRPYKNSGAGGDVYYVSSCATGRITRLLVADVSGHGETVSTVADQLRLLMRRYVNHLDQGQFVRSMNRQFSSMASTGCFATAVVTTFFSPTRDLLLCNAGHPPPLLYRAKTKKWSMLMLGPGGREDVRAIDGLSDVPLGIEECCDYQQVGVRLAVDDLCVCYTDALIETPCKDGTLLGSEQLLKLAEATDVSDPSTFISRLLAAVEQDTGSEISGDDVTVLLFRPNGLGGYSFIKRMMAPLRVFGAAARAIAGSGEPVPWPDMSLPNIGGLFLTPLNRLWRVGRSARNSP